jgi:hypothetical protein
MSLFPDQEYDPCLEIMFTNLGWHFIIALQSKDLQKFIRFLEKGLR